MKLMNEEIVWTKQQQANTLAAIDIVKTYFKGDPVASGPKAVEHSQTIGAEGVVARRRRRCGRRRPAERPTGDGRMPRTR